MHAPVPMAQSHPILKNGKLKIVSQLTQFIIRCILQDVATESKNSGIVDPNLLKELKVQ